MYAWPALRHGAQLRCEFISNAKVRKWIDLFFRWLGTYTHKVQVYHGIFTHDVLWGMTHGYVVSVSVLKITKLDTFFF